MLFSEKKSALVHLSDSVKYGLLVAGQMSEQALQLYSRHEPRLSQARAVARNIVAGKLDETEGQDKIRNILGVIPEEESVRGVQLQSAIHSHSLSTILTCCSCLESYINSFAYYLFREADYLGLVRQGRDISADILLEAIEKMTTRAKWETIAKLGSKSGFDTFVQPENSSFR